MTRSLPGIVLLTGLFLLSGCTSVQAGVSIPSVFSDHMVLQRDMKVPVWGNAEPGEAIAVAFEKQTLRTKADEKGYWRVDLAPLTASLEPREMTVSGSKDKIVLHDVLVGDVWICSGQSNMNIGVQADELAKANLPNLRFFNVSQTTSQSPMNNIGGRWAMCAAGVDTSCTAAGFYFGKALHARYSIPIGLLHASKSGTVCEGWTPRDVVEGDADLKPILDRWESQAKAYDGAKAQAEYDTAKAEFDKKYAEWERENAAAKAAGKPKPRRPKPPMKKIDPREQADFPGNLYNGMIAPLMPFAIRGVVWYQGESNTDRAWQYRKLFPALIRSWRARWGQGDFPFLFVQLPSRRSGWEPNEPSEWAELREAQMMALREPNTGMAITIDSGGILHPDNKPLVGARLELVARHLVYGENIVYSGPLYKSSETRDDTVVLHFDYVGSGLVAKGERLDGFVVAGADRKFVLADAKIVGDTVEVHADGVTEPQAVRYAWGREPPVTLFNAEGLPASPFRTDDWPGATYEKR